MTEKVNQNNNDGNKSVRGITNLIIVQVITKLFTFVLNQLIIRYLTPTIIGITSYLDFIYSTVLFFSRESLRLSIQRIKDDKGGNANQKVVNFGCLGLIISIPILLITGYWQMNYSMISTTLFQLPFHKLVVLLVLLLIVLELFTEPVYCLYQFQLDFSKRSKFEGLAILIKCVVTFASVMIVKKYSTNEKYFTGSAICGFALGQFSYSLTLFVCYLSAFKREYFNKGVTYQLVKVKDSNKSVGYYFQPEILVLVKGFFVQMIFKQFLTEGDKLLISHLCTIEEQGVYAVVSNYGSMVARLLFQPLEESTRLMFTKILNGDDTTKNNRSFTYLKLISIFYFNLSLLILFAGVTNGSFLLRILMGGKASNWVNTDIFDVFPQYIAYIPLLAFNGILEALFSCIASTSDLQKFSKYMTFVTFAILVLLYLFVDRLGLRTSGLILANMINMSLRIIYCYRQIQRYYIQYGISIKMRNILGYVAPSVAVALSAWIAQYVAIGGRTGSFIQLIFSAGMSTLVLMILIFLERDNVKQPLSSVTRRFIKNKSD